MSALFTVADVAAKLDLKPQKVGGKLEYHGANPTGNGATKDGFFIREDGTGYDRKNGFIKCIDVAKLAGIEPGQYEPCAQHWARNGTGQSNGHAPSGQANGTGATSSAPSSTPGSAPKSKTPAERGITPETLRAFGVTLDARGNWNYPTHFADGTPGRARIKRASGKPKYFWSKDDTRPAPPLFGSEKLDGATDVHFVGGEPDVMAMAAAGVKAVATFGENQGHAAAAAELKRLGVERVIITLDNDEAGYNGAAGMAKACEAVGIQWRARDVGGNEKDDVSDLWTRCGFDAVKFRAALDALPDLQFEQPEPEPEKASRFELFSFKDLARLPRQKWLIRGLLTEKTTSVISADSGCFKTFIALEMALCVATGRDFHGREVVQGAVVYVAAEGFWTILERATAWAQFHGVELPENFHVLRVPVNVSDANVVRDFAETVKSLNPVLIVLDTLSQNAVGLNENANEQMAQFVGGMMALGNEVGAHTNVLHHNAKSTGAFRGAGAIKANIDAHISLDRPEGDDENTVFVRCEKQRGKPFEAFALRGVEVELPYADEYGDAVTSLVFEPCGEAVAPKSDKHPNAVKADKTRAALMEIFDALAEKFGGVKIGMWKSEVETKVELGELKCGGSTFWAYRKKLENDAIIELFDSHNGAELYRRVEATPTTPTTPKTGYQSSETKPEAPHSNNSNIPLGVGVVGVECGSGQKPKKQSSNAASEPYRTAPTEPNPGAANDSAPDDAADGDLF